MMFLVPTVLLPAHHLKTHSYACHNLVHFYQDMVHVGLSLKDFSAERL